MDEGDRRGVDRLTIQEAARRLGISEGAVRKRVTRKTLEHDKEEDGRVYVYLDAGGRQGVDTGQDTGVDPNSNALISQLRDEVTYLRDENRRKDEIIMQQAMTMRQLSAASQETSEDAETVEEASDRAEDELGAERARREMAETTLHEGMAEQRRREEAERERDDLRRELYALREPRESPATAKEQQGRGEPRPATGGAQEGTEYPQQRGGWLAPVDKLPWWHYAIGLFLGFLAGFLTALVIEATILPSSIPTFEFVLVMIAIIAVTAWLPTTMFGLWIGYRNRHLRLWSQVLPLGVLVGGVTFIGSMVPVVGLSVDLLPLLFRFNSPEFLEIGFPACLLFVSTSFIGNAWQRRRIGRISGTTPGSPVARSTQGASQRPSKDLTPAQQAMLGWGGGIIGALITLIGTIIAARSGS